MGIWCLVLTIHPWQASSIAVRCTEKGSTDTQLPWTVASYCCLSPYFHRAENPSHLCIEDPTVLSLSDSLVYCIMSSYLDSHTWQTWGKSNDDHGPSSSHSRISLLRRMPDSTSDPSCEDHGWISARVLKTRSRYKDQDKTRSLIPHISMSSITDHSRRLSLAAYL